MSVDEALRRAEHPGIVFKDGPSGRRAALAFGPDVWEVVRVVTEVDEAAVDSACELLALEPARVRLALRYYAAFSTEVDAEIADAEATSLAAESVWRDRQHLSP